MAMLPEINVYGSNKWSDLKPFDTKGGKLKQVDWEKFYDEKFTKKQIVLHHTVSGPGITGDLKTWENYKSSIGTCVVIDRNGTVNQLFPSSRWAWQLGVGKRSLEQQAIGIELDNWGQLEERDGEYYAIYGNNVKLEEKDVTYYPRGFRGEQIFESYPEAQLRSLGELLLLWGKKYNITLKYNDDMWDLSESALTGAPGVWTHVSYRPWPANKNKWDCHPQPELIAMLKTIGGLE